MIKNQFFYQYETANKQTVIGSFALDRVVRTATYAPNMLVILLDDWHTSMVQREVPAKGLKAKPTYQNVKEDVNSEIYLNEEDSKRFIELTGVSVPAAEEVETA